jgi:phosphoribosylglycinamide formyltransferase 1
MPQLPINLAVLISGSGTTLQNLIDRIADGSLNAKITAVIASRPGIKGIDRAKAADLPTHLIDRKQHPTLESFSREVFSAIEKANPNLILLAGWLTLLKIPPGYNGKIMNIHPALLPDFGGKGMYGHHVHEAVLKAGHKTSGCTVHFVDATYDTGPIILQRTCPVLETDTAESLAARIFEEEKIAYPEAIRLFQQNRLKIDGARVRILPDKK